MKADGYSYIKDNKYPEEGETVWVESKNYIGLSVFRLNKFCHIYCKITKWIKVHYIIQENIICWKRIKKEDAV